MAFDLLLVVMKFQGLKGHGYHVDYTEFKKTIEIL